VTNDPQGGYLPVLNYADNNIIVQQNTSNRQMVVVQYDGLKAGLSLYTLLGRYLDNPWIANNIYYTKAGAAQFYDGRPTMDPSKDEHWPTYQGGLTLEWRNMTAAWGQDHSLELDPKLDAKGRSALQQCLGKGVQ
jgi:hypothetical protein